MSTPRNGTNPSAHVVAADEAGNTGANLLDSDQPVYALAGVSIDLDRATTIVSETMAGRQETETELKFATLRKRRTGQKTLLDLFRRANLDPSEAKVALVDKAWMVTAKMVDILIEPRMVAKGLQGGFYGAGIHIKISDDLHHRGLAEIGGVWTELQVAFVELLRDYSSSTVASYLERLRQARIACRDERLLLALRTMLDTEEQLAEHVDGFADALDPAIPSASWLASAWSEQFGGEPFSIVHDDSKVLEHWVDVLVKLGQAEVESFSVGEATVRFPIGLADVTFARSQDDPRIQIADLLAGSCAWIYSAVIRRRAEDSLVTDLEAVDLKAYVQHFVGPSVKPEIAARLGS